jgi:thymidylate synthase
MEKQYLELAKRILEEGYDKPTRTGTACKFLVGERIVHDFRDGFPMLTTRKLSFKLIATELLWFLSGSTNIGYLRASGNEIWTANAKDAYERGITSGPNDVGPSYGYQWRKWNKSCNPDATGGIDQIAQVINGIRADPWGRRHVVSAWNPEQIPKMALPPCHILFQFVVRPGNPNLLDCITYQRSADLMLGIAFNIPSYALLTCIVAQLTGLKPGKLIINMADVHIYTNQIDGCREQLSREPRKLPTLIMRERESVDNFTLDDFKLEGYDPHPTIKYIMSV